MKKLIILSALIVVALSCADKKAKTPGIDGAKIYKQNCVVCHGMDGKLGANGSKDLTQSKLTMDERKKIVKDGKGAMVGLGALLSAEEIQAVSEYTFKLK